MTLGTFTYLSLVAETLWEMILVYNITLFKGKSLYLTDLPLVVYHPCGRPQMPFMNLSPHWPPQHTKLEILWLGLNINLCLSRATADSQAHRTVFYGKFGTHFAKYFKPEEFCNYRFAGFWWPICSSIQINLTEFHQGKVILWISSFLHLCVTVLSVPIGCHWLWGIAGLYSDMLRYSSLKWVWCQVSLNPWQTRLILTGRLAQGSFTVDKPWSKSFIYHFTKTKGGITPREGIKRC